MRKHIGAVAVATVAAGLFLAPPAAAEERTCRGKIGAVVLDNVRVPSGAACVLEGTRVKGTVKVERSARLSASKLSVTGNVQAENHRSVALRDSRVGGSVQVKQGQRASVLRNRVTGDVQFFSNRDAITVSSNRINGNLQCKSNRPAPRGSGNIVGGNKEDQCRRL